jgi:alpha-galactosidase
MKAIVSHKSALHILLVVGFAALGCAQIRAADDHVSVAAKPDDYARDKILTPLPGPAPRINGAKVFGARPGSPFLFRIAASGARPMKFTANGLPDGLQLNETNGCITGVVKGAGEFLVKLTAQNHKGLAKGELRIVIGDTISLTPPMGWNSWYCFSESVSQARICAMADALVQSGLADHGWTYVNIDDCWQGSRGGKYLALQGNERFPNMQQMCDYVHSVGLKLGIYSTPWMGSYAGFPGGSAPNAAGDYSAEALPLSERLQPAQLFGRYPGSINKGMDKVGPYWFCDADAKQWGEWGVDYVKYDWKPNDVPTTKRMSVGLRNAGRDIVVSLSNEAPFDEIAGLAPLANLWRTTGDIHETWESIDRIGFSQDKWQPFSRPGHWNDPDMLQVGMIGKPNDANHSNHRTGLTPDEQYSQVSLWCLLSAPLLLSCDLTQMDAFTFNLLSNDEVIEVDQDPKGEGARKISGTDEVWAKTMADGTLAVGLFNRGNTNKGVTVNWSDIGLTGQCQVRDLWRQKDLGKFADRFSAPVNPHGVVLIRVFPKK